MYYNPMGGAFCLNDIERALIWQDCRMPGALPDTFQESVCVILEKMRLGADHMARSLPLTADQCRQIFMEKGSEPIPLRLIISFCVLMKIPEDVADLLIERAGYTLEEGLELHRTYKTLFKMNDRLNGNVRAANNMLLNKNLPGLF